MTSSNNQRFLIEYLSFSPLHFIDDCLNHTNSNLYTSMSKFEGSLEEELREFGCSSKESIQQEIEQGVASIEMLLERTIDTKFDRWELYCLKNILRLPEGVKVEHLPHYKDLNLSTTTTTTKSLDDVEVPSSLNEVDEELELERLRNLRIVERYKKSKLIKQMAMMDTRKDQLLMMLDNLSKVKEIAVQAGVFPVSENAEKIKAMVEEVNSVVSAVEARTSTTNWTTVPLIGTSKTSTPNISDGVENEVLYHLNKMKSNAAKENGEINSKKVSAWDVTKEYREALDIGSAKVIQEVVAATMNAA